MNARRCALALSCSALVPFALAADHSASTAGVAATVVETLPDATIIALDHAALRTQLAGAGRAIIRGVPIDGETVTLSVEQFRVTTPETRFVVNADQTPYPFDPDQVLLLRGEVVDHPGSHVFLGLTDALANGYIMPGGGRPGVGITARPVNGRVLGASELAIVTPRGGGSLPDVPLCGLDTSGTGLPQQPLPPPGAPGPRGGAAQRGLRHLQLAVETDYEFYSLFGDLDAEAAYIVTLYAAGADIYVRDVETNISLSYVRLWDTPADLFNDPDPLQSFRSYWNTNMGAVTRDAAQYLSGRRDLPAGGEAYLTVICSDSAYGWAGYSLGYFIDPSYPNTFNRDIIITTHELGHNCGTPHTHDLGLDTCNNENTPPRRGTIMSYCGQTFTGGDANHDLWFHTVCQSMMENHLFSRTCIGYDCNRNGVDDSADIAGGASEDVNGNGVPDECEDCNNNGVLDGQDIATGASLDRNGNAIPDECEPDCNGNGVPDDLDFFSSTTSIWSDNFQTDRGWTVTGDAATGMWQRGIPVNDPDWQYDPATDADGSGSCYLTGNVPGNSDVDGGSTTLTSPTIDMSAGGLGVQYAYYLVLTNTDGSDRLLVEANSNNGNGPWVTIATHTTSDSNWRQNSITATQLAAAGVAETAQVRFRFTANDANPQSIVEAGVDGFIVGLVQPPVSVDFNANAVPDECEGDCDGNGIADYTEIVADMSRDLNRNVILDSCEDCDNDGVLDLAALDHANNAWVASRDNTTIKEYLGVYGTQMSTSQDAGLDEPADLLITPDRRVLVSTIGDSRVVEFSVSGALVGNLVGPGGGGLSRAGGLLRSSAGTLLVASTATSSVKEYDLTTGAFIRDFVAAGAGGLAGPFGLAYGPGGDLYVSSSNNSVLEFDGVSGTFVRVFVAAGAGGLDGPRGLLFLPTSGNLLVASYASDQVLEYDGVTGAFVRQFSQVGDGTVLTMDQPYCLRIGPDGDVYVSRAHDHDIPPPPPGPAPLHLTNARIYRFDVHSGFFVASYLMGVNSGILYPTGFDFVPDAGTDCNNNQRPDNCDIASGRSADVNHNGIPDECESVICAGDLDGDADVDIGDLALLLSNFGSTAGGAGDLDGDGDVDITDLSMLLSRFGVSC